MNLLRACDDPNLFGPWFRDRDTWSAWRAFLAALFALPMSYDEFATYRKCTGRTEPPAAPFAEAWLVCGRRAGKSFTLALIAVFLACFFDRRSTLAPGERGTVLVIAVDRRQARVIFRYIHGLLHGVKLLRPLIQRETDSTIDLSNGATIEIGTASFRSVRGYTLIAALLDELAFFPTDNAADPDYEILDALRPGMATVPGAMLLCASSPYARRGALWDAYKRHHGKDDAPALVWHAGTRDMNPTVPQRIIDEALERDPARAAAEYLAQFRSDIESFITREVVEGCVAPGVAERLPAPGVVYQAFVDPSGGSSDSFTLAIAHRDGDTAMLDCVRERRPPFSPEQVVIEFSELLRRYRVFRVSGDRYAGQWPAEQFAKRGIAYEPATRTASDLYRDALPLFNSGSVELLDNPILVSQLCSLERRTSRAGRDTVCHPDHSPDDLANAVCGALVDLAPGSTYGLLSDGVLDIGPGAREPGYLERYALHHMMRR